jgi:hypothetical protein
MKSNFEVDIELEVQATDKGPRLSTTYTDIRHTDSRVKTVVLLRLQSVPSSVQLL